MIQRKNLNIGTILEVVSTNYMMFFGEVTGKNNQFLLLNEQYEVTKIKKSSPISIYLKQVNGNKEGNLFLVFFNNDMKIISQPNLDIKECSDPNSLADNEELILVKKGDPTFIFKDFIKNESDVQYCQTDECALVFDKKIGQRKKIKNKLALTGILNMMSGMMNSEFWYFFMKNIPQELQEIQKQHLKVFDDAPYWFSSRQITNLESIKDLELRKYNKDTRKISDNIIDFNCYDYVVNFIRKTHHTRLFGIGIASVVNELIEKNLNEEYPFLFSAKLEAKNFEFGVIPQEKDIYVDIALKSLNLKKKDTILYNNKGYTSVAFKTEDERNNFIDNYKNKERTIELYNTNDIIKSLEQNIKLNSKNYFK